MTALRRFKRRETLRICYGDIIRGQRLDTVTRQISYLADAIVEAAVAAARRNLEAETRRAPRPRRRAGAVRRAGDGQAGRRRAELLQRHRPDLSLRRRRQHRRPAHRSPIASSSTAWPATSFACSPSRPIWASAYRVDLRLRPEGEHGPIVISLESALHYYDVLGPHLGTAGVRQSPAGRRRSRIWARSFSSSSNRGSIAAI